MSDLCMFKFHTMWPKNILTTVSPASNTFFLSQAAALNGKCLRSLSLWTFREFRRRKGISNALAPSTGQTECAWTVFVWDKDREGWRKKTANGDWYYWSVFRFTVSDPLQRLHNLYLLLKQNSTAGCVLWCIIDLYSLDDIIYLSSHFSNSSFLHLHLLQNTQNAFQPDDLLLIFFQLKDSTLRTVMIIMLSTYHTYLILSTYVHDLDSFIDLNIAHFVKMLFLLPDPEGTSYFSISVVWLYFIHV